MSPLSILTGTLLCAALCARSLPAAAQCDSDYRITDHSEVLFPQDKCVRFAVSHFHMNLLFLSVTNCYGFLDVKKDSVVYHSLDETDHSFSLSRTEISEATAQGNFAHLVVRGKNFNLLQVTPRVLRERLQVNAEDNVGETYQGDELVSFLNNFDGAYAKLFDEMQAKEAKEHPPAPLPEPPKPKPSMLMLTTKPGGAEVYLDGRFQGHTSAEGDLTIESSPGQHQLRLDLADYKESQRQITMGAGESEREEFTLEKAGPKPLSVKDVEEALVNMSKARVIKFVEQFGVDFSLTAEIEGHLREKNADNEVLLAIAKNKK